MLFESSFYIQVHLKLCSSARGADFQVHLMSLFLDVYVSVSLMSCLFFLKLLLVSLSSLFIAYSQVLFKCSSHIQVLMLFFSSVYFCIILIIKEGNLMCCCLL